MHVGDWWLSTSLRIPSVVGTAGTIGKELGLTETAGNGPRNRNVHRGQAMGARRAVNVDLRHLSLATLYCQYCSYCIAFTLGDSFGYPISGQCRHHLVYHHNASRTSDIFRTLRQTLQPDQLDRSIQV